MSFNPFPLLARLSTWRDQGPAIQDTCYSGAALRPDHIVIYQHAWGLEPHIHGIDFGTTKQQKAAVCRSPSPRRHVQWRLAPPTNRIDVCTRLDQKPQARAALMLCGDMHCLKACHYSIDFGAGIEQQLAQFSVAMSGSQKQGAPASMARCVGIHSSI